MTSIANVTIHLSQTTLVLIVAGLFVGYLIGNVFPFSQPTVGTTPQPSGQVTPPTQQQQTSRVQVSVDDDPSIGDKNAKVTVIEFSDFQS